MFATSCAIYLPLSKIERYFPSTSEVSFINEVQSDMIYIGKLKVVPSDYSFSFDREKALTWLTKAARQGNTMAGNFFTKLLVKEV